MAASSQVVSTGVDAETKMRSRAREEIVRPSRLWRLPAGSVETRGCNSVARMERSEIRLGSSRISLAAQSELQILGGAHELALRAGIVLRPLAHLIALV